MQTNALYFGDNLKVLSERQPDGTYRFPSESIDLIYLDPPFNSNRNYNLIFREQSGERADAQIQAFEDTWHWDATARDTFEDLTGAAVNEGRIADNVAHLLESVVRGIGHNDMSAYLVMMTPRLVQMHRVLKRTGFMWLHCDPTASHYLKIVLDAIFGPTMFRNEIVWRRSPFVGSSKSRARFFPHNHDVILGYSKTDDYTFNQDLIPYTDEYKTRFKNPDNDPRGPWQSVLLKTYSQATLERLRAEGALIEGGSQYRYKFYLEDAPGGRARDDVWADRETQQINPMAKERLGYPTQKPLGLLERIINASSNPGDSVLDPFCGCGTALVAAQRLGRLWIGIDVTHLSIAVMRARLMDSFGLTDVPVHGVPQDLESARMLAAESRDGRYEFQWWALGLIDAKPIGGDRKKGADKGIDGVMTFSELNSIQRILVSVKSGKPSVLHVKELIATLDDQGGAIGVLIELDPPTEEMSLLAVNAGRYESELWGGSYERVQIISVGELLAGKKPNVPKFLPAYQKAAKIAAAAGEQQELFGGTVG